MPLTEPGGTGGLSEGPLRPPLGRGADSAPLLRAWGSTRQAGMSARAHPGAHMWGEGGRGERGLVSKGSDGDEPKGLSVWRWGPRASFPTFPHRLQQLDALKWQ